MLIGIFSGLSAAAGIGVCAASGAFADFRWLWILPLCFAAGFLLLAALWFLSMLLMAKSVDMEKPQEKDDPFFRTFLKLTIEALVTVLRVHIHTEGMENIPKDGRFLLVCNHLHDTDPVVLMWALQNSQLAFISKREVQKFFLVGELMHKILCQPINRENDREALKTILKCIQIIKEDKASIAVFPEGYIHADKKLHHFRPGVFKIATKTKVPIVVCTLRGTPSVIGRFLHGKPSTVEVRLLRVTQPEEYEDITTVELGDRIYKLMAEDLGPEMVGEDG